jgi:hypothetical protein
LLLWLSLLLLLLENLNFNIGYGRNLLLGSIQPITSFFLFFHLSVAKIFSEFTRRIVFIFLFLICEPVRCFFPPVLGCATLLQGLGRWKQRRQCTTKEEFERKLDDSLQILVAAAIVTDSRQYVCMSKSKRRWKRRWRRRREKLG